MRGKVITYALNMCNNGITPAHAGKSPVRRDESRPFWDHPRPCGEKHATEPDDIIHTGSPPPMRGKVADNYCSVVPAGITPAHAGKRARRRFCESPPRDHPRPCGEKGAHRRVHHHGGGSPPPMRGKAQRAAVAQRAAGITPAHAGKSLSGL